MGVECNLHCVVVIVVCSGVVVVCTYVSVCGSGWVRVCAHCVYDVGVNVVSSKQTRKWENEDNKSTGKM